MLNVVPVIPDKLIRDAYEIAKEHAAVDGAFSEKLMLSWFEAAFDLCAAMVGFVYPERQIEDHVNVAADGSIKLSHEPSSDVRFYAGASLIAVLPPGSPCFEPRTGDRRWLCCPSFCCYCNVTAVYMVGGIDRCAERLPGWFVQAVARLFAYQCENRGEVEMDASVLSKCGAKAFLAPYLTYVM